MYKLNGEITQVEYEKLIAPQRTSGKSFKKYFGITTSEIAKYIEENYKDHNEITCIFCGSIKKIIKYDLVYKDNNCYISNIQHKNSDAYCKRNDTPKTKNCKGKTLNANSIEFVSLTKGISPEEANELILSRNKSPFYRTNYSSDEEYSKAQARGRDFFKTVEEYNEHINKGVKSRSLEGFQEKYGAQKGYRKWKLMNRKKDNSSLKYFIKKYGEEIGRVKFEEKCKSSGKSNTLAHYIEKYGIEKGTTKWENRAPTCFTKDYWYSKGYTEEETSRKRKEISSRGKQFFVKKYGVVNGLKKYIEYRETNSSKLGISSKESLNFFLPLINEIDIPEEYFYIGYGNKKEYFISTKNNFFMYDFCIPKIKLIIEYNGSMFHYNPDFKYKSKTNFLGTPLEQLKAKDELKTKTAMELGFTVLTVFDTDNLDEKIKEYSTTIKDKLKDIL